jgi:dihydroflavonol-4-reductase
MSSQILITGATGFIGRQLTRDLVAQGRPVRILARQRRKAWELFGGDVDIRIGDLDDADSVARACRGAEIIYHIAGSYRFGLRHRRGLWRANVEGTETVLRAAMDAGARKVVHLSSGGVLRQPDDARVAADTPLDETDFPAQAPRFSAYKASKWHAEQRALEWARRGLPVTIASTTCPIGRGDELPTPTGRMILDFLQGRFPFYCHTGLNFIGVGDLSRGLQLVAEEGRVGERYLLSDENLWLKEFLDLLARETGRPAPERCLPGGLVRLIGCGGELADLLNPWSSNARVCLETALQSGRVQFFNNAKARRELGWKPLIPIGKSVRDAVAGFRDEPELVSPQPATSSVGSHVQ